MKGELKRILLSLILGVGIPWVVFGAAWELRAWEPEAAQTLPSEEVTHPTAPKETIPVLLEDGTVGHMELDAYLTGVLLKELPANFEEQAKMAQAVVARTYALRTVERGIKHSPPAICTKSRCCQAYISVEEYLASGGSMEAVISARLAVENTAGWVLTYEGKLIDATYFSCSGGKTEDALAVWGSDIPYLQSVESPGEEHASHYTDTVSYTSEAFQQALGVTLPGRANSWFGEMTYTQGGGVDTVVIGGSTYKGTTLRTLLGLRSTAFTLTATADSVVITTKGFGHRVGMSQYGADAMAAAGSSWEEILKHYYRGAEIDKRGDLG